MARARGFGTVGLKQGLHDGFIRILGRERLLGAPTVLCSTWRIRGLSK